MKVADLSRHFNRSFSQIFFTHLSYTGDIGIIAVLSAAIMHFIGIILGSILEANLRRSLLISREGYWIYLDRPVSATLVIVNVLLLIAMIYLTWKRSRNIGSTLNSTLSADG